MSADPAATISCRICGCTDDDCGACIERTGMACYWVEPDLCSACVNATETPTAKRRGPRLPNIATGLH